MRDVATDTDDLFSSLRNDVGTQTSDLDIPSIPTSTPVKYQTKDIDACSPTAGTVEFNHKLSHSNYDSDTTILNTPEKDFDPDETLSYTYKASDDEIDSDATRLDTPLSIANKEVISDVQSDSSGSYIETYVADPTYTGPAYHSQPCSKHGASYTPPGWRKIMIKRRRLEFPDSQDIPSDN